jgi:hypothetical protein
MNKEAIFEMELQIYLGNPDKFQLYINKKYYQNLKEKIQLYIISISQWVSDNKDLCSLTISLAAFIFTIFTYYVSKKRSEYDKKISDARYKEQKMQYEKQLCEERKRREEDKKEADRRNRISEEPYLVFKCSKVVSNPKDKQVTIEMVFLNKGRGSAYSIVPDVECDAKNLLKEGSFKIYRSTPVEDPIATVGEKFVTKWSYDSVEKGEFSFKPQLTYQDASGRKYIQTYEINIIDDDGNANIINFAKPELCE